jgi:hypothetical protein
MHRVDAARARDERFETLPDLGDLRQAITRIVGPVADLPIRIVEGVRPCRADARRRMANPRQVVFASLLQY